MRLPKVMSKVGDTGVPRKGFCGSSESRAPLELQGTGDTLPDEVEWLESAEATWQTCGRDGGDHPVGVSRSCLGATVAHIITCGSRDAG